MQDKKNEREKENTKDSSCWFQSRKTVHISWAPPPTLRIGAETVQWLNRFHPGDLCPRSLSSGCPQRHLLSSYWEWCSHGWTKSSELGLVEACIKSLFFYHSLFPRVPFADEESTAQLVPLCVSYSNDCLPATPKRYCSYPLPFWPISVFVSVTFYIPWQGSNCSLWTKAVLVNKQSQLPMYTVSGCLHSTEQTCSPQCLIA